MTANIIYGSICLSDIPTELIKRVECKDGKKRAYLNIKVVRRKEVGKYGHTHFISCEPREDERVEGVKYIIGDMKEHVQEEKPQPQQPTAASNANDDLPF